MGRITFTLPEGDVHVDVLAAIESDDTTTDFPRRTLVFPVLRVTTYGPGYDAAPGFVKVKGKRYSIDHIHVRTSFPAPRDWQGDSRTYLQRYTKTEGGNSLDYRAPSRAALSALEESVRDRFVAEFPQWESESKRLRLAYLLQHAEDKAAESLATAEKLRAEALALQAEIDAL